MTTPPLGHGQPGHINAHTLDTDDDCTGFGTHARCIVYGDPQYGIVTVTADLSVPHLRGLPCPTVAQARKVAMGSSRVHDYGRLRFQATQEWINPNNGNACVDLIFEVVGRKPRA